MFPIVRVGSARPAHGSFHRRARGFVSRRIFQALVEHHHDVAAEGELDIDGRLGREHVAVAVEMRLEHHALFRDLAQPAQAEDLEASGIGEDGPRPIHELVQAAELADGFVAGPQIEMIGVAEDDVRVEVVDQIPRQEAFDSGLCTDRHEDGSFDVAMSGVQNPRPRPGPRTSSLNFKTEH